MSSFIRYEQAPVEIKKGSGGTACTLVASSLTAGENLPLQAVRALGYNGAVAVAANGPVEGTWSTTYTLIKSSVTSTGCGSSMSPDTDCDAFMSSAPLTWGSGDYISVKVGSSDLFAQGMANSLSITVEPNAIVTATLGGNFYDGGLIPSGGAMKAGAAQVGYGTLAAAHGSTSTGKKIGFSCDPFSASYEASRGFNPIYSLGSLAAKFVMITDPQQSVTFQGENIPNGTVQSGSTPTCVAPTNATMSIKDTCGNAVTSLSVCGYIQSRDIEIAENDVLRGNVTIVDYTGLVQSLSNASCS